jgi:hypothetical protein
MGIACFDSFPVHRAKKHSNLAGNKKPETYYLPAHIIEDRSNKVKLNLQAIILSSTEIISSFQPSLEWHGETL